MNQGLVQAGKPLKVVTARGADRVFFNGPVDAGMGVCYSRGPEADLFMVAKDGTRVLWRSRTDTGPYYFVARHLAANAVIIGSGAVNGVAAFSVAAGSMAWSRGDLAGLLEHGGKFYSEGENSTAIVEVDPGTGEHRTVAEMPTRVRAMGAQNGMLILCHESESPDLAPQVQSCYMGVGLDYGTTMWQRDLITELRSSCAATEISGVRNVVAGSLGDRWIGRWGDMTFAIAREDGRLLWLAPYRLGLVADVCNGRVFGMDEGGLFHVLDERTGELIARHDGSGLEDVMFPRPAAMLDDYAVYGTESGHVIVFDPRDARVVWSKRHKAGTPNVGVVDGRVYVTTDKGELLVYERA